MALYVPQADFVTTTLNGAISNSSTSFTIGTGLTLDANGGVLQIDFDSTTALGSDNGPETVIYTAYNSTTGAVTGVTRAQAGTTAVAHANGASVMAGTSSIYHKQGTTLGYAEVTANQTPITSIADLTGLTVTVTVPDGGRRVKITGYGSLSSTVSGDVMVMYIYEGATRLQFYQVRENAINTLETVTPMVVITPTAGAHTYKLQAARSGSGDMTLSASSTNPAFILAELI